MSVLRKINRELQTAVANAALPLTNIISRTKPWGESDEPFAALLKLNLKEAIQQTGGTTEEELIVDGEVMAYTIMRGILQVRTRNLHFFCPVRGKYSSLA